MNNDDNDLLPPDEPDRPPPPDDRRRRRSPRDRGAIAAAWTLQRRHATRPRPPGRSLPVRALEATAVLAYGAWTAAIVAWVAMH